MYRIGDAGQESCTALQPVHSTGKKEFPQQDQLPEMIGIVIRQEHRLPKDRLAAAVGDSRKQVGVRTAHQLAHRLEVILELPHTLIPAGIAAGASVSGQ